LKESKSCNAKENLKLRRN